MENIISSRHKCWYSDKEVYYSFPNNWEIQVFSHENTRKLEEKEIYNRIQNPIGCQPLSSQLRPGMKVLVICDDISRPTRSDLILPIVLDILGDVGIGLKDVSILIASGSHAPMSKYEKILKFGNNIIQDIRIMDHDYRGANIYVGDTRFGTPVYINKHLMESDFVLGIGGIYPHNPAGFGGGAKLILGVCGDKTIKYFHFKRNGVEIGGSISNEFREDILDASRLVGINFVINSLLSKDRDIISIFAGDVQSAYAAGIEKARKIYGVPNPSDFPFDLVVADAYPFDSSFAFTRKGWWPVRYCHKHCFKLIISAIPNGIGSHPLFPPIPNRFQRVINLYNEYQTSSIKNFIKHSIIEQIQRGSKKAIRRSVKKIKNRIKHAKTEDPEVANTSHPSTALLHSLPDNFSNESLPFSFHFTNSFEDYIDNLRALTDNRSIKVGFYQTSSLTFPK